MGMDRPAEATAQAVQRTVPRDEERTVYTVTVPSLDGEISPCTVLPSDSGLVGKLDSDAAGMNVMGSLTCLRMHIRIYDYRI